MNPSAKLLTLGLGLTDSLLILSTFDRPARILSAVQVFKPVPEGDLTRRLHHRSHSLPTVQTKNPSAAGRVTCETHKVRPVLGNSEGKC